MARLRAIAMAAALAALLLPLAPPAAADDLRFTRANLPPGAAIERAVEATPDQVAALAKRFGAQVEGVVNQVVGLRGLRAQANFVSCPSEEAAVRVAEGLRALKGGKADTVGRSGTTAVEIVGPSPLLAKRLLAAAGALPDRPAAYGATLRVACLRELDYMRANEVFNLFLAPDAKDAEDKIRALTRGWKPGNSLALRSESRPYFEARYDVAPAPGRTERRGDETLFSFDALPTRAGLPYVDVTARITVRNAYAPAAGPEPGAALTEPTGRWPASAPAVRDLARRLTEGREGDLDRADALVAHVYAAVKQEGPRGTRYGVEQVLGQGFGHCWDMSDLFVTLCRAAGIPARQVAGWVPSLGSGHVWAEVHIAGQGWLPVDATTPWLGTSDDYVPWFSSSDGEMPVVYLALPAVRRAG